MLPIPLVTRICQRLEMRPERTDIHTQLSHATPPGLVPCNPAHSHTTSEFTQANFRRQIPYKQRSRQLAYTTQLCALAVLS